MNRTRRLLTTGIAFSSVLGFFNMAAARQPATPRKPPFSRRGQLLQRRLPPRHQHHNRRLRFGRVGGGSKPDLPPQPLVSLVYPNVYPAKWTRSKSEVWRDL